MCERCNQNEVALTTPIGGVPTGLCLDCLNVVISDAKAAVRQRQKEQRAMLRERRAARHCQCGIALASTDADYDRCSACQKEARSKTPIYTKI